MMNACKSDSNLSLIFRKEAKAKGLRRYFTGRSCKRGHIAERKVISRNCMECEREYDLQRQASNPERHRESNRKHYASNIEKCRKHDRQRQAATPEKRNARNAKRYALKLHAAPPWLTKQHLQEIALHYKTAKVWTSMEGDRYVVDHIVPLKNHVVCGLHVPWNLHVITEKENLKKHNRFSNEALRSL